MVFYEMSQGYFQVGDTWKEILKVILLKKYYTPYATFSCFICHQSAICCFAFCQPYTNSNWLLFFHDHRVKYQGKIIIIKSV